MRTLICFVVCLLALAVLFFFSPYAHAASIAAGVTVAPMRLDFSPLIPVINGMIVTVAGVLTAASPAIAFYIVVWLRNHGIAVTQAGQKLISDRIAATIQNGLKYAESGADAGVSKLTISVANDKVAQAANYAIKQSPALLKSAGIDVTTEAGQQTLVRRITAEAQPALASAPPALDLNVKTS